MQLRLPEFLIPALNFVLIGAIAYFAALSADDLIARRLTATPSPEQPFRIVHHQNGAVLSRASYSAIVDRDVFNAAKPAPEPVAPVAVDLHIKLLGTSELTSEKPFAIIEDDQTHQQWLYRLGDEIPDAGTIIKVERTRILINHDGEIKSLEISGNGMPAGMVVNPPAEIATTTNA